jgi:5-methylcytosine-specific restriction endonuclease McrA
MESMRHCGQGHEMKKGKSRWICPSCLAEARDRHRASHPGLDAEQQKSRYWDNHAETLASIRDYRTKKREHVNKVAREWARDNMAHIIELRRQRHAADTEKTYRISQRVWENRRRAWEANAAGECSKEQWQARVEFYGGKCWLQLEGCTGIADTMDHVIPLALGGANWASNLRPACKHCNSSKKDKSPWDLLAKVAV